MSMTIIKFTNDEVKFLYQLFEIGYKKRPPLVLRMRDNIEPFTEFDEKDDILIRSITDKIGGAEERAKRYYLAEELAEELRVNVMTIYRYIKAGRLKAHKIGGEFRIDKVEFDNFLKRVSTK